MSLNISDQRCAMISRRTAISIRWSSSSRTVTRLLIVAGMEITLSKPFAARKVDLRTAEDLSPYFRQEVLDMAEVQYMRARCNSPETCQN